MVADEIFPLAHRLAPSSSAAKIIAKTTEREPPSTAWKAGESWRVPATPRSLVTDKDATIEKKIKGEKNHRCTWGGSRPRLRPERCLSNGGNTSC